jgi:flagellar basal-body rod modification protein FlgD
MGVELLPAGSTTTVQPAASGDAFSNGALNAGDFLTLMIQELVNQDPLDPMKNQDLLNQVSQIKNMQTLSNLDTTLSGMTTQQGVATAGSLIGKQVSGVSTKDANVTGVVDRVTVGSKTGVTLITTAGDEISLSKVSAIAEAPKK